MTRLSIAVLLLLVRCQAPTEPTPPMTFLLLGQSNMVGMGMSEELAPADTTMPANATYQDGLDIKNPWDTRRFGPELTLAQDLGAAFPDREVRFVKHAIGGTSLLDWAPQWDSTRAAITGNQHTGPMYEHTMAIVDSLRTQESLDIAAVFWMQGERDARIPEAGVEYFDNLTTLIAAMRKDLASPEVPFFMGRVNPPAERYAALEDVRLAQFRAAAEIPNVILVDTDDLTKLDDDLHYDTGGVMEMGRRFAAAYVSWSADQ